MDCFYLSDSCHFQHEYYFVIYFSYWQLKWAKPTRSKRKCRKAERCPLHHLKVLRLSGYYGRTSEVELVRYFLENAIALQKIIVDPRPQHVYYVSFSLDKSEEEQMARQFAKLQLEGEVPSHIEFLVL